MAKIMLNIRLITVNTIIKLTGSIEFKEVMSPSLDKSRIIPLPLLPSKLQMYVAIKVNTKVMMNDPIMDIAINDGCIIIAATW